MQTADRDTHVRIVSVALIISISIAWIALAISG
jgi:hypothetical protein